MISEFAAYVSSKVSTPNLIAVGLLFLSALGSALFVYWRTIEDKSLRSLGQFLFPREILTHPSAKADFMFWITRRAIMPFILFPSGLAFVAAVAWVVNRGLGSLLGIHEPLLGPPGPITTVIFTVTMVFAYDLSYYLYHLAQHKVPALWELHKVHHSAEVMVGVTKDRVHPVDEFMNRIWDGVIPGICFGIWTLISLNPVEATIFGVNVYVMRNLLMMDFVRHMHLRISFGWLDNVVLCPHWHQLHHSVDPSHYDKNFGLLFSFWDRMFGTLCVPRKDEQFKFGLMERDVRKYQSLWGLYVMPLVKMWKEIVRLFRPAQRTPQGIAAPAPVTTGAGDSRYPQTRLEIIRTGERLDEVAPAWDDLWEQANAHAFQSHAWIRAWWNGLPDQYDRELLIVLAWRGEALDAVLPLARSWKRGIRLVEWAAKDVSDYCDAVLRPGCSRAVLQRMWEHLSDEAGFDAVYLSRLLPAATMRSLIGDVSASGHGVALRECWRSEQSLRFVNFRESGDAWFDRQPKKFRQNYRRGLKRLSEQAEVRFRLLAADEPLSPVVERLVELKRAWLQRNGLHAALFDAEPSPLPDLVRALAAKELLRVFVLEADGVIVAVSVNFVEQGTMRAFLTAFDLAYAEASPGAVLMIDYIRWSLDHGYTTVDFLCGSEGFKSRFATTAVTLDSFVGARTIVGRIAIGLETAVHALTTYWRRPRPGAAAAGETKDLPGRELQSLPGDTTVG